MTRVRLWPNPFATIAQQLKDRQIGGLGALEDFADVEGESVSIEYRWAQNELDRLPGLVTDLVRRQVAVIVAGGGSSPAVAAKAATATIPIVFAAPEDPVRLGLVASLGRPGGNATGVNFFVGELVAKQFGLLRELLPSAIRIAVLINPANAARASATVAEVEAAAPALGLQIQIFNASTIREIYAAFAAIVRERPDGLFVGPDPYFVVRRVQLANLAARHGLPALYFARDLAEAGGLMSYGTDISDAYRQVGIYTGRILKGAKPADLPVVQSTKFELVINSGTAMMLGLDVPPTLLARADEVIE